MCPEQNKKCAPLDSPPKEEKFAPAGQNDPSPEAPTGQPPIPAGSYELRIIQSLRRIIRAVEIHSRKLSQNFQITGPQLSCLIALQESEALTTTSLAKSVHLSPSTVVGIVDRLEEKGLVTRCRSSKDRRQVLISATAAGHRLMVNAPSPLQDTLGDALKELPELEQVSITLALEKVVDLMEARKIEASPILETGPISTAPAQKPPAES